MSSVVITGAGIVSPLGNDLQTFCKNLQHGMCGIKKFRSFDSTDFQHDHAGEVDGYYEDTYEIKGRKIGKVSQFAIDASFQAVENAGLDIKNTPSHRIAVIIGTTMAGVRIFEILDTILAIQGLDEIEKPLIPEITGYSLSANLSYALNHSGISQSLLNACASGNTAIIYAKELLEQGVVDYCIAGGADVLTKITLSGFSMTRTVDKICRPFDMERKGIVLGEGAGMVVMERKEKARKRGADIWAEVAGYGINSDAYHPTAPHPEGTHMARATQKALNMAKISADKIDYICAHGTGTLANDLAETNGVKKVFGDHAYKVPISSIKSMLGHMMGASSAAATIACVLSMKEGFVPPTINYNTPDPKCDLDYVPNTAREKRVDNCLVNAFAFGGMNTTLVLQKNLEEGIHGRH